MGGRTASPGESELPDKRTAEDLGIWSQESEDRLGTEGAIKLALLCLRTGARVPRSWMSRKRVRIRTMRIASVRWTVAWMIPAALVFVAAAGVVTVSIWERWHELYAPWVHLCVLAFLGLCAFLLGWFPLWCLVSATTADRYGIHTWVGRSPRAIPWSALSPDCRRVVVCKTRKPVDIVWLQLRTTPPVVPVIPGTVRVGASEEARQQVLVDGAQLVLWACMRGYLSVRSATILLSGPDGSLRERPEQKTYGLDAADFWPMRGDRRLYGSVQRPVPLRPNRH
ncbi:hypothetical protein RWX45_13140 [Actinomyces sp. MRS3W]|nr:hypothetical protein [Actinomyces sp. MRS3W]